MVNLIGEQNRNTHAEETTELPQVWQVYHIRSYRNKEYRSNTVNQIKLNADSGPFHNYFMVRVLLIVENPIVTVKCRTTLKFQFPLLAFMSKCNVE